MANICAANRLRKFFQSFFKKLTYSCESLDPPAFHLCLPAMLHARTDKALAIVHALWNARLEPYADGDFDPYYDGLLHLISLLHLSGKYRLISPLQ
jgi:hypothetical protein